MSYQNRLKILDLWTCIFDYLDHDSLRVLCCDPWFRHMSRRVVKQQLIRAALEPDIDRMLHVYFAELICPHCRYISVPCGACHRRVCQCPTHIPVRCHNCGSDCCVECQKSCAVNLNPMSRASRGFRECYNTCGKCAVYCSHVNSSNGKQCHIRSCHTHKMLCDECVLPFCAFHLSVSDKNDNLYICSRCAF